MKALMVGYGSIGSRHLGILQALLGYENVDLVSRHAVGVANHVFDSIYLGGKLAKYDYFVIASETVLHYEMLSYICSEVSDKVILVEKPLFDEGSAALELSNNTVYVAYNLRFNPVLQELKAEVTHRRVLSVYVQCGQYLPSWRPGKDYMKSYSSSLAKGGGVMRDLSHEFDYCAWLFGGFNDSYILSKNTGALGIAADEVCVCIGTTERDAIVSVSLDYLSRKIVRRMLIHCEDVTIDADLVGLNLEYSFQGRVMSREFTEKGVGASYYKLHHAIISGNTKHVCSYREGLRTVRLFSRQVLDCRH